MEFKKAKSVIEERRFKKLITDIENLDKYWRGGIRLKKVIEVVGKPGTGRTRMCLKLCLNVQIPKSIGGLGGRALYLDTRRSFDPATLKKFAKDLERRLRYKTTYYSAAQALQRVYFVDCLEPATLVASIMNCQSYLAADPNIRLIIINSLSFSIRMLDNISERTALLMELNDCIRKLMHEHEVIFLIINELGLRPYKRRRFRIDPLMGQKYSCLINERIWLTKRDCFLGKSDKARKYIGKLS